MLLNRTSDDEEESFFDDDDDDRFFFGLKDLGSGSTSPPKNLPKLKGGKNIVRDKSPERRYVDVMSQFNTTATRQQYSLHSEMHVSCHSLAVNSLARWFPLVQRLPRRP